MSVKLEVGKWYVDGEGVRWCIGMQVPHPSAPCYEFYGYNDQGKARAWCKDGCFLTTGSDVKDLIREWKEPRSIKVDVYMMESCGEVYKAARDPGQPPPRDKVIGKKTITINEGDGMEEKSCQ